MPKFKGEHLNTAETHGHDTGTDRAGQGRVKDMCTVTGWSKTVSSKDTPMVPR